jgi:hypothetical protein
MVHSLVKLDLHRHDQPGYFALEDLPAAGSVADISISHRVVGARPNLEAHTLGNSTSSRALRGTASRRFCST